MRSAPTLKIWMTPFASVAIIEKLALLKIAFCKAPVFSRASWCGTSVTPFGVRLLRLIAAEDIVLLAMILNAPFGSPGRPLRRLTRWHYRRSLRLSSDGVIGSVLAMPYIE